MTPRPSTPLRPVAEQVIARCSQLAQITDIPGQTTRTFLSPATRRAHALVTEWMQEAGLRVSIDRIGNLHGVPRYATPSTPRVLLGSHLDTVIDAGAFDGPLGVLCGIALAGLVAEPRLPYAVEIVALSEEEGVRFGRPFLGSLALTGASVPDTVTDADGVTLAEAIQRFGHTPTAPDLLAESACAYLEIHIEQGPVLEAENRPVAAVSDIVGQSRLQLTFHGEANHAGTTPMRLRRDALAAAAAWIVSVEACARETPGLVATVGSLIAEPGLGNVIPKQAMLSLDVRHADDAVRRAAVEAMLVTAHQTAASRGLTCASASKLDQAAVAMDSVLTGALVEAAARHGLDARSITSGAGHDAMILARVVPACMLFVRSPRGLSHHPEESVYVEDVEAALATVLSFLQSFQPANAAAKES